MQDKARQVYASEGKSMARQNKARKAMAVQSEEGEGKLR
jgi:hypothetical protein